MTVQPVDPGILTFVDTCFVNFEDSTYRWVDIKRFSVASAMTSDEAILEAVIRTPQYRDHYTTPDSQSDTGTLHGPYLLSCIAASVFEKCGRDRGLEVMREFSHLFDVQPSPDVRGELDTLVFEPLAAASAVFRLKELSDAQHEFGWVLDEFRELIVISADRTEVVLLVAAID